MTRPFRPRSTQPRTTATPRELEHPSPSYPIPTVNRWRCSGCYGTRYLDVRATQATLYVHCQRCAFKLDAVTHRDGLMQHIRADAPTIETAKLAPARRLTLASIPVFDSPDEYSEAHSTRRYAAEVCIGDDPTDTPCDDCATLMARVNGRCHTCGRDTAEDVPPSSTARHR